MRRFRRRFGRRLAKTKFSWVTNVFAGTGIDRTGATRSAQILLRATDWEGNTALLNKKAVLRRVIVSFGYTFAIDFAATSSEQSAVISALIVEDEDEIDPSIMDQTSAGVMQRNRVLHTDLQAFQTVAGTDNTPALEWSPSHYIDWSGKLTLQSNQVISLSHQLVNNMASSLLVAGTACRAWSRCLIEQP